MTKDQIRKKILEERLALSLERVHSLSLTIQQKIVLLPLWKKAQRVGLYSPVKNEVETRFLFTKALEEAKNVYFPRVEQGVQYYEVNDPADLQKGAWGVLEPKHGCVTLPPNTRLDLVIIPGIGFSSQGFRLGYGRGFYDRFLTSFTGATMGLAYEFQMIPSIPIDLWDCRLQYVMTEKKEYLF